MRELSIDWAALHSAFQMNMPEVRCFLALEDGRVLKLPPGDPSLMAVRGDPNRFIAIDAIPSRIQYQWLAEFIASVEEGEARNRMEAAINGKGAFRRFKDILLTLPEERRRWFEYRDQMMRQRIVEWVREQGISPENPAPWTTGEAYLGPSSEGMHGHEAYPHLQAAAQGQGGYPSAGAGAGQAAPGAGTAAHGYGQQPELGLSSAGPAESGLTHRFDAPAGGPAAGATGFGPPAKKPTTTSLPDNFGNVAPQSHGVHRFGRAPQPKNNPHELEALRDFLIEWSDKRDGSRAPNPLELEQLADEIGKHFHVQSTHL